MCGGNTEETYLEVFCFKKSYKHFVFAEDGEGNQNKFHSPQRVINNLSEEEITVLLSARGIYLYTKGGFYDTRNVCRLESL